MEYTKHTATALSEAIVKDITGKVQQEGWEPEKHIEVINQGIERIDYLINEYDIDDTWKRILKNHHYNTTILMVREKGGARR